MKEAELKKRVIHDFAMIDEIDLSERNKEIVIKYVGGKSQKELSTEYGLTQGRISSILFNYVNKCSKLNSKQIREEQAHADTLYKMALAIADGLEDQLYKEGSL